MKHLPLFDPPPEPKHVNPPEVVEQLLSESSAWAARVALEMHRSSYRRFDAEDLVQEARIGLWKAARLWNPASPVRFRVYAAHWVKNAVKMATRRKAAFHASMKQMTEAEERMSKLDDSLERLESSLSKASGALLAKLSEGLTVEEIAAQCGVMVADVEGWIEKLRQEVGR